MRSVRTLRPDYFESDLSGMKQSSTVPRTDGALWLVLRAESKRIFPAICDQTDFCANVSRRTRAQPDKRRRRQTLVQPVVNLTGRERSMGGQSKGAPPARSTRLHRRASSCSLNGVLDRAEFTATWNDTPSALPCMRGRIQCLTQDAGCVVLTRAIGRCCLRPATSTPESGPADTSPRSRPPFRDRTEIGTPFVSTAAVARGSR